MITVGCDLYIGDHCRLRLFGICVYVNNCFVHAPSSAGLADDGAAEVASGLPGSHGMESDTRRATEPVESNRC